MFTQLLSHRRTPAHLFTISVPLFYLYYMFSSIKWIPATLTTFQHMPLSLRLNCLRGSPRSPPLACHQQLSRGGTCQTSWAGGRSLRGSERLPVAEPGSPGNRSRWGILWRRAHVLRMNCCVLRVHCGLNLIDAEAPLKGAGLSAQILAISFHPTERTLRFDVFAHFKDWL